MAKYEVIRPWFGKKLGDVVELKKVHPALKANVRALKGAVAEMADLVEPDEIDLTDKDAVIAELTRRGVAFDARQGVGKLADLLK